jgi:CrcB protein
VRVAGAERAVLVAVSAGGALGALARYGIGLAAPTPAGGFPWATFAINVAGCAAIGALLVLTTEVWTPHRLARPFLAVGVLGGFTTFSTYALEARGLLVGGSVGLAVAYLLGTLLAALVAVQCGVAGVRWSARRGRGRTR